MIKLHRGREQDLWRECVMAIGLARRARHAVECRRGDEASVFGKTRQYVPGYPPVAAETPAPCQTAANPRRRQPLAGKDYAALGRPHVYSVSSTENWWTMSSNRPGSGARTPRRCRWLLVGLFPIPVLGPKVPAPSAAFARGFDPDSPANSKSAQLTQTFTPGITMRSGDQR